MLNMENKLWELLEANNDNLKENTEGYGKGYAEGYHDAILDIMYVLNINPKNEEYFN